MQRGVDRQTPRRRSTLTGALVAIALTSTLASASRADAPPVEKVTTTPEEHHSKGKAFFDQQKYQEAKSEFSAEEELAPSAVTELYLARACEELGEPKEAVDWYEKALATNQLPPKLSEDAHAHVSKLTEVKASSGIGLGDSPKEMVHRSNVTTMWLSGGGAVFAFALGGYFGLKELSTQKKFDATPTTDLQTRGRTQAILSDLSFGAGLALAVICLVTYVRDSNDYATHPPPKLAVSPYVGARSEVGVAFGF